MRRGQALVEFAVIVPVFLLILTGTIEFGFAFTHNLTVEYATREAARAGAALPTAEARSAVAAAVPELDRPSTRS